MGDGLIEDLVAWCPRLTSWFDEELGAFEATRVKLSYSYGFIFLQALQKLMLFITVIPVPLAIW